MEGNYLVAYRGANRFVELTGGDRRVCWGSMIYACAQGHEERYYLGIGVEGPPALRAQVVDTLKGISISGWEVGYAAEAARKLEAIGGVSFIPSPFYAGGCHTCGGQMKHIRWKDDEEWKDFRFPPDEARYFAVPDEETAKRYAAMNYGGAELVDPERVVALESGA